MANTLTIEQLRQFNESIKDIFLTINKASTTLEQDKYKDFYIRALNDLEYRLGDLQIALQKLCNNYDDIMKTPQQEEQS